MHSRKDEWGKYSFIILLSQKNEHACTVRIMTYLHIFMIHAATNVYIPTFYMLLALASLLSIHLSRLRQNTACYLTVYTSLSVCMSTYNIYYVYGKWILSSTWCKFKKKRRLNFSKKKKNLENPLCTQEIVGAITVACNPGHFFCLDWRRNGRVGIKEKS